MRLLGNYVKEFSYWLVLLDRYRMKSNVEHLVESLLRYHRYLCDDLK